MEQTRLTPSQVAELLGVSTRTLNRYSTSFSSALSETASRKGRKKFYDGHDIQTLQRAQEMMKNGLRIAEIAPLLTVRTDEHTTALIVTPEIGLALGEIRERTRNMVEKVESQDDRLDKLEKWASQSWWKKIFTKLD